MNASVRNNFEYGKIHLGHSQGCIWIPMRMELLLEWALRGPF